MHTLWCSIFNPGIAYPTVSGTFVSKNVQKSAIYDSLKAEAIQMTSSR